MAAKPIVTPTDSPDNPTIDRAFDGYADYWHSRLIDWSHYFAHGGHVCILCNSEPLMTRRSEIATTPAGPFCQYCAALMGILTLIGKNQRDDALTSIAQLRDEFASHLHPVGNPTIWLALDEAVETYICESEDVDLEGAITALALGGQDETGVRITLYLVARWYADVYTAATPNRDLVSHALEFSRDLFCMLLARDMAENALEAFELFSAVGDRALMLRLQKAVDAAYNDTLPPFDKQHFWDAVASIGAETERNTLHWMPYEYYLKTDHWFETRRAALERAGNRCQVCNSRHNPNVHHRTYERRGAELPEDVIVLCRKCHEIFHREGRLAR